MKKAIVKIITAVFIVLSLKSNAQPHQNKITGMSVEIDPAPFFNNGYSVATGYEFNRFRLSVNLFKSDLPSFAVQEGWEAKIKTGSALRIQYYFNDERKGFYAGAQAGFLRMNYKKAEDIYFSEVTQVAITPTFGYRWFPFSNSGFYLMPAAGVGFTIATSGKIISENETYNQFKPAYITALHLGYEF